MCMLPCCAIISTVTRTTCVSVTYPAVDQFSPTLITTSQWLVPLHSVTTVSLPLTSVISDTGSPQSATSHASLVSKIWPEGKEINIYLPEIYHKTQSQL
jgi:hypothetical protein